jgi:hypothetical protein
MGDILFYKRIIMLEHISCVTCKHKRCIEGVLYCVYSPKMPVNGKIVNAKIDLCREVVRNKKGKCFSYNNWEKEIKTNKSLLSKFLKNTKKVLKKIKNEVSFLR